MKYCFPDKLKRWNYMNKGVICLIFLFSVSFISAEDSITTPTRFGISLNTGEMHSLGFVISFNSRLFTRAVFNGSYSSREREVWDYGIEKLTDFRIGGTGSLFFRIFPIGNSRFYFGPEISVIRHVEDVPALLNYQSYVAPKYDILVDYQTEFALSLTLGSEYFFNRNLGIFGEFGLGPYYSISSLENEDKGKEFGFEMSRAKIGFDILF
jgi:hypothetical protein